MEALFLLKTAHVRISGKAGGSLKEISKTPVIAANGLEFRRKRTEPWLALSDQGAFPKVILHA